jgi:hypothetical protein
MFTIVPVELQVKETAIGVTKAKIVKGYPFTEMIAGEVVKIEEHINIDRWVHIRAELPDKTIVNRALPEFRIVEFTFGGVLIPNPKFDAHRIEKEDKEILKTQGLNTDVWNSKP